MALKKNLTKAPVKKKPISRSAIKSIDDKYMGPEPIVVNLDRYSEALSWYNYMCEADQARDWLLEYLKKSDFKKADIAAIRRCPKYRVPTTIGWISRMLMNGNKLRESTMEFFKSRVDEVIAHGTSIKEEVQETAAVEKPAVSIQERTQAKIDNLITMIEEELDTNANFSLYEFLKGKEATVQAANAVLKRYQPMLDELNDSDPQIKEAWGKKLKKELQFWETFISDCERYCGNKKATKVRKPREKKQKSAVDLVKNMKYQKEFPQLKIVSVNPAEVVGCQQLWVYNTKYKKLSRYDASGPNGIQVKGTTLIGFDVETSLTKSLRKPDTVIQQLLGAGKVGLRKFMDEIKTNETKPNGRINSDTILLRVIK